ncbi:helix-turn-helix domain-containing protein [Actinomadura opuntiae]|uniref:helix-turn-helix domain-containing protein n=1 Tax=Actinomadura sp. OS1-43 TaxID=604315 RepID=UPI00255A88B3|nr:MerR family transcriptional regulator [Actinomadura sp. OS1-43]MDL4813791.1 MerR family transcriptional regulator [Actinomadura sp. OS1-43]
MDGTWTIGELAERAVAALAAGQSAQVNGRVRDLPNERLIRWYTTIGLIDPPAGRRGRTALYGPRHLLQLVAIKRRQAAGRSIAEIQLELAAATNAMLERIAALPPEATDPEATVPPPGTTPPAASIPAAAAPPPEPASGQGPFDTESTTDTVGKASTAGTPDTASTTDKGASAEAARAGSSGAAQDRADGDARSRERFWSARPDVSFGRAAVADGYSGSVPPVVQGVRLAPGLTLLLEVGALDAEDLHAIESAARPLLDVLAARGLIASPAGPVRPPADPPRRPQ